MSWDKFKPLGKDMTVLIPLPKVTEVPEGLVLNLFQFSDQRYCPVTHINKLYKVCRESGRAKKKDLAFEMSSGVCLSMRVMNKYLTDLLPPLMPGLACKYSCHSFRAGLPSLMASMPEYFSENDVKISGRWASTSSRRYTRLGGIAQRNVIKKVHRVLKR